MHLLMQYLLQFDLDSFVCMYSCHGCWRNAHARREMCGWEIESSFQFYQSHWWTLVAFFDCFSFRVVAYTNIYIGRQRKQPYTEQKVGEERSENICVPTALRNSGGMFDDSQPSLIFPFGTSYVEALRQKPEGRGSDSRRGNYDFSLT